MQNNVKHIKSVYFFLNSLNTKSWRSIIPIPIRNETLLLLTLSPKGKKMQKKKIFRFHFKDKKNKFLANKQKNELIDRRRKRSDKKVNRFIWKREIRRNSGWLVYSFAIPAHLKTTDNKINWSLLPESVQLYVLNSWLKEIFVFIYFSCCGLSKNIFQNVN